MGAKRLYGMKITQQQENLILLARAGNSTLYAAVASIKQHIRDIREWMYQEKLLINDAKTELLLTTRLNVSFSSMS